MSGQKFQYDESGGTFFYFLLSFLALLLVPSTFYLWPRAPKIDPKKPLRECHCDGCKEKQALLKKRDPWKKTKARIKKGIIILGWLVFAFLFYKVSQFDYEMANFDPFEILGVAPGSSANTIRRAYRKLSLILHPDKETGNEKAFMKLTKAYQALTDKEAMKNWEKYGNPDGPGVMGFGIALPSWIVEKKNSVWVLGLYALVFMVALPTAVGMWWYKSIRFTGDQVLLVTTKLYLIQFNSSPLMSMKKVIMVLGASYEFDKKFNAEIIERLSDNKEVPALIKQIPNFGKNREYPFIVPYARKTRALIHSHLSNMLVNPETLGRDRQYIVKKCPYLIQEMISCMNQLSVLFYTQNAAHLPKISTFENVMKLCPMIVQGLWDNKSPFLQLPHITEDMLKHFKSKKCFTLQQFAQLKREDRRTVLRCLNDSQFDDVMKVLGHMPYIEFKVKTEVIDDDVSTCITAGAFITITVTLDRKDMKHLFGDETIVEKTVIEEAREDGETELLEDQQNNHKEAANNVKKLAWRKQKKNPKKAHNKKSGPNKNKQQPVVTKVAENAKNHQSAKSNASDSAQESDSVNSQQLVSSKIEKPEDSESDQQDRKSEDMSDDEENGSRGAEKTSDAADDDESEWMKFQERLSKRDRGLEGRSNKSHEVHCPKFPEVKQEYWWVYVCDKKSSNILTAPTHVTSLVDHEEFQLKLSAPPWAGMFTIMVWLRSDSYFGFNQSAEIKLDVKEAPEPVSQHPQWDISDEETAEDVDVADENSEYTTDEDISDNE